MLLGSNLQNHTSQKLTSFSPNYRNKDATHNILQGKSPNQVLSHADLSGVSECDKSVNFVHNLGLIQKIT